MRKAANDVEKIGMVVEMKWWLVENESTGVQMKLQVVEKARIGVEMTSWVVENDVMGVQKHGTLGESAVTVARKIDQPV